MKYSSAIFIIIILFLTLRDSPEETATHYPRLADPEYLHLPDTSLINKVFLQMFSLPFQYSPYIVTSNKTERVFEFNDSLDGHVNRLLHFMKPEDIKWMQRQDERNDFRLNDNSFVYKCLISLDSLKSGMKSGDFLTDFPAQFKEPGFNLLSLPLFSLDYRYFIIKVEYYCGALCGEDALLLYKNEGGNFKYLETIQSGIY